MEREIELLKRYDAQVSLQAAFKTHAGFSFAVGGNLFHARISHEPSHDYGGVR